MRASFGRASTNEVQTVATGVVGEPTAPGSRNGAEEDLPVGFVFLPVADVELDESDDATWDVSRIGS